VPDLNVLPYSIPRAYDLYTVTDVTRLLDAVEKGEPKAAEELIPLVYDELRRLAAHQLAQERPDQTLQATALVHEAYLRLLHADQPAWRDHRHFFNSAAEAMRRILIENARRKMTLKRGARSERVDLDQVDLAVAMPSEGLLALHEALSQLEHLDQQSAELVKLRYFAGLTRDQAAETLGISPRMADKLWSFARAWLFRAIREP